jgi:Rieske Fe-S protein
MMQTNRRDFCAHAARATCCAAIGLVLESCGGGGSSPTAPGHSSLLPTVNGTRMTGGIAVTIDSSSPLAAGGTVALVQSSAGSFLVAHTGGETFVALTAICTHQGCTITNVENQTTYVCPCHGSTFDLNGRVLNGPALAPLRVYATQLADGVLTIAA